jgi:hypothetical protein
MSQGFKSNRCGLRSRISFVTLALLLTVTALPAFAALGGDISTVQADLAHMQGSLRITQSNSYSVHEIQSPTGVVVREYVSPTGKIFAVAWQGPWIPDMQQLLGAYFQQYADAAQAEADKRPGRRPLQITQPGFVLQMFGHMRSFSGRAYVPEMVPPGVRMEAIQ